MTLWVNSGITIRRSSCKYMQQCIHVLLPVRPLGNWCYKFISFSLFFSCEGTAISVISQEKITLWTISVFTVQRAEQSTIEDYDEPLMTKLVSWLLLYIIWRSQVAGMNETEVEQLGRHLGHDARTHKDFYRLSHSAVQLCKVDIILRFPLFISLCNMLSVRHISVMDFTGRICAVNITATKCVEHGRLQNL